MKAKNEENWLKWKESQLNEHDMSITNVVGGMESFSEAVEKRLSNGEDFKSAMEKEIHSDFLNGFNSIMIDALINFLVVYWVHGEDLRVAWNARHGYSGKDLALGSSFTITARG